MVYPWFMTIWWPVGVLAAPQELTISVAIDFSYNLLIQTDVESQVYNTTTASSYILNRFLLILKGINLFINILEISKYSQESWNLA